LGEGVVKQFFENGFDNVKKILSMKKEDMIKLDKFGVRKSQKIVDSINEKRTMTISKLQHASGLFKNLGSKKLLLLEHLYESNNVSVENITCIEGFSDISAKSYLDSINVFKSFVNDLGSLLTINETGVKEVSTDGGLNGQTYLFTGVRRKDLEELLTDKSANVSKTMSKKVTHLVCKDKSSKSSKMLKAIENGCVIMNVNDLEQMLSVV
jgi:DNA ligase (NAD+)